MEFISTNLKTTDTCLFNQMQINKLVFLRFRYDLIPEYSFVLSPLGQSITDFATQTVKEENNYKNKK